MRRLKVAIVALLMTMALVSPVLAENRDQWYHGEQPPSAVLNTSEKNPYIGLGQLVWDIVGRGNTGGFFTNAQLVPNTGMYVTVAPINANQYASLYQIGVTDVSPFGSLGVDALPADANQIFHQALTSSTANSIGPLAAPTTSGQSIDDLIECQVKINDLNIQSTNFVSNTDVASASNVPLNRDDQWYCQAKFGTQAVTPTVPTVDAGWVAFGYVTIPYGATSIDGTMLTTYPNWNGFLPAGSATTFMDLQNNQTAAGNKTFSGITTLANLLDFTNGSVTFSNLPQIAGDFQASPGLIFNVATGSKGVQFMTGGSLNGAYVNTSGTYYTGSSYLAATALNVNGTATIKGATFDGTTVQAAPSPGQLVLNSGAVSSGVRINYGNSSTIGLKVYDGGTTNYSTLTSTGLQFSGASTSSYSKTDTTLYGNLIMPGQAAGQCAQFDANHHLVAAGGACGLASGTLTSVTGDSNILATTTSGAVSLTMANSPIWTGAATTHSGYIASPNVPTAYNVYVATTSGAETLQNGSPIPFGTNWTEATSGLASGLPVPSYDTSGYVAAPSAATTGSTSGGTMLGATYYVVLTYLNSAGETLGSTEVSQAVATNNLLTVNSPVTPSISNSVGIIAFGTDKAYALQRNGGSFLLSAMTGGAAPTLEADGGFVAGSSSYYAAYASVNGPITATQFNGSGVGLLANTVPNASLVTPALTGVTAGSDVVITPGTGPSPVPVVAVTSAPAFSGSVTFNNGLTINNNTIKASAAPLTLNAGGSASAVVVNKGNTSNNGVNVYDGGSTNYVNVLPSTGMTFSGTTTAYGPANATITGTMTANSFTGSGAGLASGTIPNAALVTAPVTTLTCSLNIVCGSGTTPTVQETMSPTYTGTVTSNNGMIAGASAYGATSETLNGALSLSPTTTAAINSNATGSAAAFTLNNTNATTTTGDLLDLQLGGSTKFSVLNGGGISTSGVTSTGTTNSFGGWPFNATSGTDFYIGSPSTTAATLHFRTNGYATGSDTASLSSTGVMSAIGGYASTLAYGNWQYVFPSACAAPGTGIGSSSATNVNSVVASLFEIGCTSVGGKIAGDTNGNLGLAGNLYLGSSNTVFFGSGVGVGEIGTPGSGTTVATVGCSLLGVAANTTAWRVCIDTNGNIGANGFYTASRREWKQDIKPLGDPFAYVPDSYYTYRYDKAHGGGNGSALKAGFMANDTNALLAGPHHDHMDLANSAGLALAATANLNKRVKALESGNRLGVVVNGTTHDPRITEDEKRIDVLVWWLFGLSGVVFGLCIIVIGMLVKRNA